ncbi:unnamed protein product [Rotaria sp. Silwood2]|nr:unnamed protein product [Rotaria sp. Silwood2]CAF3978725.1 unnamed protein product [Rotaria sp. Silwood2]
MVRWLFNDLWRGQTIPWLMPPPPQLVYSNNNSPMNSFLDYTYPVVDRLSRTFTGDSIFDFYRFQSNRASVIENSMKKSKRTANTFNRDYQLFCCLGKGGFGQVYDGRRKSDNSSVIVKILPKDRILNWGIFQGRRVPYEIEVLWRLRGLPGIINIYDHVDFVMECPPLANTEVLRHIFREMIRINMSLQSYGVWHRDCKPENILYCRNDRSLRFIDFGSAAPANHGDFHEFQGTLEIMTPEWILERHYDGEQACVWTLGVCLYFLLFQQYPFRSKAEIVDGRSNLPFSSSTDKEAYQTMKQCLNKSGYRRPKLNSLLYLSWLQ